jgi:hypothetical protein
LGVEPEFRSLFVWVFLIGGDAAVAVVVVEGAAVRVICELAGLELLDDGVDGLKFLFVRSSGLSGLQAFVFLAAVALILIGFRENLRKL